MAARKVPDVPGIEIIGFGKAAWIDDGGADAAFENERPFSSGGVPMHFAHRPGFKPQQDTNKPQRDRQLRYRGFLAVTVADHLAFRLFQREFESRKIRA